MKRYRAFRRISTGAWLDVLFAAEGDDPTFSVPAADQAADLAAALDIDPDDLEAVEGDTDPRSGDPIVLPVAPPSPPDPAVAQQQAVMVAARLTVTDRLDDLPDDTIAEVAALFPDWAQPTGAHDAYPGGVIVRHDRTLWRSTTAANVWEPGVSGWHRYGAEPDAGPQPWVAPTGSHDAHPAGAEVTHNGAEVTHNGRTWENSHGDGNVWEPGVYGWTDVGPA